MPTWWRYAVQIKNAQFYCQLTQYIETDLILLL